jgi:putative ABC transport system permease protein
LLTLTTSLFRNLFSKKQVEQDLDEELQSCLEMLTAEKNESGMSRKEARRQAQLELGGVEQVKEQVRRARIGAWIDDFWKDFHHGLRTLRKSPGFCTVAILTLALGIGANTAIFSIIDGVLLKPLPYYDPDRLVAVFETRLDKPDSQWGVSQENFYDWKQQSQVFESFSLIHWYWGTTLLADDLPERLSGRRPTEGYLEMLGAQTSLGRLFLPEDYPTDSNGDTVILSHHTWQRVFGADPEIIGKPANLGGSIYTVVGVLAPDFHPLMGEIDFWTPRHSKPYYSNRKGRYFGVVGRLKEGVELQEAQAELDVIARRLADEYPDSQAGFGARVQPLQEYLYGYAGKRLFLIFGAVLFVLLIACANVANLMMVRAAAREKEMAVRSSLGASRFRLTRQLLTESLVLALLGAACGLFLAFVGSQWILSINPGAVPRVNEITVNARVLGFTLSIAVLTGLLFGLIPAFQASKPNFNEALKETGQLPSTRLGRRRVHGLLVMAEIALSLVLLLGAGLMIQNIRRLLQIDPGFRTENLVTMEISLPIIRYINPGGGGKPNQMKPQAALVLTAIQERLRALPGVSSVSMTDWGTPLDGCTTRLVAPGTQPPQGKDGGESAPWACYHPVGPDYFHTVEIPLLKGQVFTGAEGPDTAKTAVISESLARRYFQGTDPIGRLLTISYSWGRDIITEPPREIVGIVGEIRQSLYREPIPAVYIPYSQLPEEFPGPHNAQRNGVSFILRSLHDPADLGPALREVVASVARDVPIVSIETIEDVQSRSVRWSRFYTWLLTVFAGVALVLAAVGVFGVTAYSVTLRTREIGIRMALGAQRRDVIKLVMRQTLIMAVIGLGIGLAAAAGLTRFLASELHEVEPTDPVTFAGVSLLFGVLVFLACLIPAWKATKLNPMEALRCE